MPSEYAFIPGLELNRGFFHDVVQPLLTKHFPELPYSAALMGYGSDVLGVDTATSMDHNWGPRLQILLAEHAFADLHAQVDAMLRRELPVSYQGFPTNFTAKRVDFTQAMLPVEAGPVNHIIEILTIPECVQRELGIDFSRDVLLTDWLTFPEQGLIELTRGAVFHDGLNALNPIRAQFAFYPQEIWCLKMAVLWHAIAAEEAFIGRNHALGSPVGAHLITARIVNYLMKVCFYLERQYIPYSKWFGTLFQRLRCADDLAPVFAAILKTEHLPDREAGLAKAYAAIGQMHNALRLTEPIDFRMQNFYGRPYQVVFADRIVEALQATIQHAALPSVPLPLLGIGLLTDGVDMRNYAPYLRQLLLAA